MVNGSKGAVIMDNKNKLKEQLQKAIEDRDKYEIYVNQAQFDLMKKEKIIKQLESALVRFVDLIEFYRNKLKNHWYNSKA